MSDSSLDEQEREDEDIQEPAYIQRAVTDAWHNSARGQYYSLKSSLMALLGIGCSIVCWGLFRLFAAFGDRTLHVGQYLQGIDFILDAGEAARGKLGVVRPSFVGRNITPTNVHYQLLACKNSVQTKMSIVEN